MAKPDLPHTSLQVGDMNFVNSGLLGKINLPPAALFAQIADSFTDLDADIKGHPPSIGLVQTLYLVDALFTRMGSAGTCCSASPIGTTASHGGSRIALRHGMDFRARFTKI